MANHRLRKLYQIVNKPSSTNINRALIIYKPIISSVNTHKACLGICGKNECQ
jgi:hypothetical protein